MLDRDQRDQSDSRLVLPEPIPVGMPSRLGYLPLVFVFLVAVLGVGWRLVDLTEWPFPFHQTVQYESALAARTLWLHMSPAARTPDRSAWLNETGGHHIVSPPLLPAAVAACYCLVGEEVPWISKVFTALLWVGAGGFVFGAVLRQTGSPWAGAIACAWFVFTPYGLMVSRSFQTEPVAVFGFALAVWHLSRPGRCLTWRQTLASAAICGIAAGLKPGVLLPPIVAGFAASLLSRGVSGTLPLKAAHVVAFAAMTAAPSVVYVMMWLPHRGAELQASLLTRATFYEGVALMVWHVVGYWSLALGAAGIILAACGRSYLGVGLVAGYLAYVGAFTHHCSTHGYYHAPLLVIVGYGMGLLSAAIGDRGWRVPQPALAAAAAVGLAVYLHGSRLPYVGPWRGNALVQRVLSENAANAQKKADTFRTVRELIRPSIRVIVLSEDYGYPVEYATGLYIAAWPYLADAAVPGHVAEPAAVRLRDFMAAGFSFLVVTDFAEFESQSELQAALQQYGKVVFASPEVRVYELAPGSGGTRVTAGAGGGATSVLSKTRE